MKNNAKRMVAIVIAVIWSLMLGTMAFAQENEELPSQQLVSATQETALLSSPEEEELPTLEDSYINPLYSGIITEADLLQPEDVPAVAAEESPSYCTSPDDAGVLLRDEMVARHTTARVYLNSVVYDKSVFKSVFSHVLDHTGDPVEGDYLRWQYGGWKATAEGYLEGGLYKLCLTYTITYYTTAEQEKAVTDKLSGVMPTLTESTMTNYEKVKAIYDYICKNVTYDYTNLNDDSYKLKYTAYGALIDGTSVCQGYAVLLYRMALMAGVDCRLIPGNGNGGPHAWNIMKMGDKYYNVDATWDAVSYPDYKYFLKSDENFENHTRDAEWKTDEIYQQYPMGEEDYTDSQFYTYELDLYDNAVITEYTGNETVLKIPDTIDGYTVVEIEEYAFGYKDSLTSVTIPDSVTAIDKYAFWSCQGLTHIELPAHLKTLGFCAFGYCQSLTDVTIPASAASSIEADNAYTCSPFDGCTNLTNIHFGVGTTKIPDQLFSNCPGITKIDIPDTVTEIGFESFSNAENLASVTIPDSVTVIQQGAFKDCKKLTDIKLPKDLETLGWGVFENCKAVTKINIPANIVDGEGAFAGCPRLKTVVFEEGITKIPDKIFLYCDGIRKIVIPDTVTVIGSGAFNNCRSLTSITLPKKLKILGDSAFGNCSGLAEIVIPDTVTVIGHSAFEGASNLKTITIPESVTEIQERAFFNCSSLTGVTLPKKLKTLGDSAFWSCTGLKEINIPVSLENSEGSPFIGCTELKTINFENGITKIPDGMFTYSGIAEIEIPDTVTNIGDAFRECVNLCAIKIPASVTAIKPTAFEGSENVKIYGDEDSYAKQYAEDNNIPFVETAYSLEITTQPQSMKTEENTTAQFRVQASGKDLTYQWQLAYAGSDNWQNVPASFEGGKTDTLAVTAAKGRNGYKFRCIVKDSKGNTVTSNAATLTIEAADQPLKILSLTADKTTADSGDLITVTANVAGGAGGYTYKFIINDTTNDSWYKLQDYKGTNSIVWKATSAGTKRIMVDVKDKAGNKVATNISIKVNGTVSVPLSAELKSSTVTVKQGETVTLTAVAKGGSGKYNYKFIINDKTDDKWYRLQDFGANNVITWKATTPGTKRLMVDVMDSTGKKVGHNITITVTK